MPGFMKRILRGWLRVGGGEFKRIVYNRSWVGVWRSLLVRVGNSEADLKIRLMLAKEELRSCRGVVTWMSKMR